MGQKFRPYGLRVGNYRALYVIYSELLEELLRSTNLPSRTPLGALLEPLLTQSEHISDSLTSPFSPIRRTLAQILGAWA